MPGHPDYFGLFWITGFLAFWALFFGLNGWASVRALRRRPDFPHKRELLRGAHWSWTWVLGTAVLFGAINYLGQTFTPYRLTTRVVASLAAFGLLLIALRAWGPWYSLGPMFWRIARPEGYFTTAFQREPFTLEQWLEHVEQRRARWRRRRRLIVTFAVLFLCGWACLTAHMVHVDRLMAHVLPAQ